MELTATTTAVVVHVGGREEMVRRGGGVTGVEVEIGDGAARGRRRGYRR